MMKSILILADEDLSKKCVVIETSTDLIMKSCDPKSFNLALGETKEWSSMVIEVKNALAFFCDIEEITF
jgi:hypothetical protein